jgi:hypothetical protein
MKDEQAGAGRHRTFLLRCWLEEDGPPDYRPFWRFTLLQVGLEPARRGFACLNEVMRYLEETLETDRIFEQEIHRSH